LLVDVDDAIDVDGDDMLERDGGGSDDESDATGDTTLGKRVVVVSSVSEK